MLITKSLTRLRNCFRCGLNFRSEEGKICPDCQYTPTQQKKTVAPKLSVREKQVVDLVSRAKLNKEIAYELHLSEGTTKQYLNRIFRKLGTANRTELAVWALRNKREHEAGELSTAFAENLAEI